MTRNEIITELALKTGLTKKLSGEVLTAFLEVIVDHIIAGERVRLNGVGTFFSKERAARTGINPQTQEKIEIPARTVLRFKASKTLKDTLK